MIFTTNIKDKHYLLYYMSFYCDICCIYMKSQKNFNLHVLSARHKFREQNASDQNSVCLQFKCTCGKSFTKSSNLSRHRKKCTNTQPNTQPNTETNTEPTTYQSDPMIQILQDALEEKNQEIDELLRKFICILNIIRS